PTTEALARWLLVAPAELGSTARCPLVSLSSFPYHRPVKASPTTESPAPAPGLSFSGAGGARSYGPWLVGLGSALWGTESAWRIPLNDLFDSDVIVFWEHVILVLTFLPLLLPRLGELRRVSGKALGFLVFSGVAGSAVGTIFFTLALRYGNPIVVNVIPN